MILYLKHLSYSRLMAQGGNRAKLTKQLKKGWRVSKTYVDINVVAGQF